MNKILLVAAREYRQITRMRSFWLTLLILPFAFAITPLAQRFMGDDDPRRVLIIDQSARGLRSTELLIFKNRHRDAPQGRRDRAAARAQHRDVASRMEKVRVSA